MPGIDELNRKLGERLLASEKRIRREQWRPQIKYKITYCPRCEKKIEYSLKDPKNFNATILCPHCGCRFKLPALDSFLSKDEKEDKAK